MAAPAPPRGGAGMIAAGEWVRLARADVLERVRRTSFLVALAVMAYLVNGMLPRDGSGYRTFMLGDSYRPLYSAAWVGTLVALLCGVYFLMVGFYLVKGSVERDRRTGVGQILAASRLGRVRYLAGKTLSNFCVLGLMSLVAIGTAIVLQRVLGEAPGFDLLGVLLPFVVITAPIALFVSAGAVLFECIRPFRGGLGNIAWFFAVMIFLGVSASGGTAKAPWLDLTGTGTIAESTVQACHARYHEYKGGPNDLSMGVNISPSYRTSMKKFAWPGVRWTFPLVAGRLVWVAISFGLVLLGATVFDRFDDARAPAKARGRFGRRAATPGADEASTGNELDSAAARTANAASARASAVSAASLSRAKRTAAWLPLVLAEIRLALVGQSRWWYAGAFALLVVSTFVPIAHVRNGWLPALVIWPVLAWSRLGQRERSHDTAPYLFSTPHPLARLVTCTWISGLVLALIVGAPYALRCLAAGDMTALGAWLAGAAFIPALALALGVWTGSGKFFEVLYLFLWYVGPLRKVATLDFTGTTLPRDPQAAPIFAAIAAALLVAAYFGRKRQLAS